jgi:hypothetical protein
MIIAASGAIFCLSGRLSVIADAGDRYRGSARLLLTRHWSAHYPKVVVGKAARDGSVQDVAHDRVDPFIGAVFD